ncbi:hypothetical protein D9619_011954 [Psilocybe cf. subviscida]|uniref:Uncharacterized protein n=1 Tax=Psilocybe cf. subviscida TaxID=2480587 RepID=A0A8H5EVU7_9AGAR|nr:hypothetical protein D9619_011954 [Psilocybe cf. subviscida]
MSHSTSGDSGARNVDSGASMFRSASNINIQSSTFINGSGGMDKKKITDAMALLGSRAEKGAPYDAAAREDVPMCHEHTRVAIIDGRRYSLLANTVDDSRPFHLTLVYSSISY